MIPAPFEYVRVADVDEAVRVLAGHPDEAKVLAGGHSLLPMMKLRLAQPEILVDISRIGDLAFIRPVDGAVSIGAGTTHADLAASDLLRAHAPLVAHAASQIGDPQIRHRGTIGGSLAHADPAADLPVALLACGAVVVAVGPGGRREITAGDFFTGFFTSVLEADEVLVEIRVPLLTGIGWGYRKFVQRANDWAIVGAAVVGGRVALSNMGPTPLRAAATEQALAADAGAERAAALAADGTSPIADRHADGDYRRHLARVLVRRALEDAAQRPS